MPLSTLVDLLNRFRDLGRREALCFDNGYRTWRFTYEQLHQHIAGTACLLCNRGLKKKDRLILWCENRPEWVFTFWACVLTGIEVVPVDSRSSPAFLVRIQAEVRAPIMVAGESVEAKDLEIPILKVSELEDCRASRPPEVAAIRPDDVVQIVYTSGTTGRPRGIVHRHSNLCANLEPFRREIQRYRKWARPFQPLRLMCLLPMSHLFGQAMSLYIPPLLGGAVVLTTTLGPAAVISSVKRTRVSVLTVVPRMLLNLREELQRRFSLGDVEELGKGWLGAGRRWWKFRRVHSTFGFKFWCLVVGGASVGEELESFWRKLGFLVVQGYGLTESSPVISVNHPFDTRRGSAGKVIAGQDVRIAEDGEILVRGASVASEFTGTDTSPRSLVEDGWLHTGDLGEIDREGRIYIRGRKKEVIVTSAGLNVFPEDVEKALAETPGIHEAVAIGLSKGETEVVHAVVILEEPALEVSRLIQLANRRLEEHQRISSWTVWPRRDFPRTPSTEKIKRREVALQLEKLRAGSAPEGIADGFEKLMEEIKLRKVGAKASSTLSQDLGLSSLDRVELMSRLEDHFGVDLEEERFSELTTVGELEQILGSGRPVGLGPKAARKGDKMPRWAVRFPFHPARRVFQACIMGPLFRHYMELKIENLERLGSVRPPVLFAANHASHLDTVALLVALPPHWRSRVAPAMRAEFFRAGLDSPSAGIKDRASRYVLYLLACGLFGAYPLPQRMAGVRSALKYTGELVESGFCPLVFPEGRRSPDGKMRAFQPGLGLMAQRLRVPVIPVKIEGTFSILSVRDRWPRRGVVSVKFAPPMTFRETDPAEVVCQIEGVVRDL